MMIVYAIFCCVVVLETAHVFSPLLLAWGTKPLRRLALESPAWYVALPIAAFGAGMLLPFWVTSMVFYWWNIYHFGMQNYGVLSIWAGRQPRVVKWGCVLATGAGMILPIFLHSALANMVAFVGISVTHWLTDLGLSAWRSRRAWAFIAAALAAGALGFIWFVPHDHGYHRRSAQLTQLAMSISFVHFLYSRWVWKLSDPQVRATIGRDLFPA
jgi:hypothetical protein